MHIFAPAPRHLTFPSIEAAAYKALVTIQKDGDLNIAQSVLPVKRLDHHARFQVRDGARFGI
jgi:hypothetical protein